MANRALFNFAMVFLAVAFLGAVLGVQITQAGITVRPWRTDIPLIIGLMVLFIGNFNYYTRIIEPQGESAPAALLTLAGMLVMVLVPIVVLLDNARPWRYLLVGLYGILVIAKNRSLAKRMADGDRRLLYRIWTRRAMLQTAACVLNGVAFLILMDLRTRRWLFEYLIEGPIVAFKPAYEMIVNLTFNATFMAAVLALFVTHQKDLTDLKDAARAPTP